MTQSARALLDHSTVEVGDRFEMVVADDLLRAQIVQYAGASGDFHPFHVDEPHAREHGFDGVFAHGMLTMGVTGRLVSALGGDAAIRNYSAEMRRQVWPGDTLTAVATVAGIERSATTVRVMLELATTTQDEHVALTGTVVLELEPA